MSDYMQEAFESWFKSQIWGNEDFKACLSEAWQAAMLAHIQRGAVPEGWQLVPKEPTPEMLAGGWGYWLNVMAPGKQRDTAAKEYAAMLAAAPSPDCFRDATTESEKVSEQSAFEDWLEKKSPSGDSESVQRQWERSSEFEDWLLDQERAATAPAPAEVPEGWKEATIAWEVCASIHREYAEKKDPFFTTRQADFIRHAEAARAAMLAAAPSPDCFRDAAKMVLAQKPMPPDVAAILADNMHLMYESGAPAPAEVPMPEPDMSVLDTEEVRTYSDECIQQYGAACRAAGKAAGYARGLNERNAGDETLAREIDLVMSDDGVTLTPGAFRALSFVRAALRGEVKP